MACPVLIHVHLLRCHNISTLQTVPGWEVSPLVTSAGTVKEEGSMFKEEPSGPTSSTLDSPTHDHCMGAILHCVEGRNGH